MSEVEILTTDEVAKHLRISKRTLLREVHDGKIEAFRVGKALRFTREAVAEYKEKQKVKPGETIEEDSEEDSAA
jgi:excisionase family DNA binding protein